MLATTAKGVTCGLEQAKGFTYTLVIAQTPFDTSHQFIVLILQRLLESLWTCNQAGCVPAHRTNANCIWTCDGAYRDRQAIVERLCGEMASVKTE